MGLSDDVASVLYGVHGVHFKLGAFEFHDHHFTQIGREIRNETILVVPDRTLPSSVPAAYNPALNYMCYRVDPADTSAKINAKDLWISSAFVHEATHAINDKLRRTTMSRIDNEVSAYFAQWIYLKFKAKVPDYYFNLHPFDKLGSLLGEFKLMAELAGALSPGTTLDVLADPLRKLTEKLRLLLSSSSDLYSEAAGLMSDDMLGVPIRCRLRKLDKAGKKLHVNVTTGNARSKGKAETVFKYNNDTGVYDKDGNPITSKFDDARLIYNADLMISCEKAGAEDEAVWVTVR